MRISFLSLPAHPASLFRLDITVFFLEFLDPARAVDEFLLTGEKGMAGGADFNADFFFRRTRRERVSAGARDHTLVVFRVNVFSHGTLLDGGSL